MAIGLIELLVKLRTLVGECFAYMQLEHVT